MSTPPLDPSRWEKLGRTLQLKTRIFDVDAVRYRHPARATERDFVVINAPDWVNVIALTPDHQLVMVRQFRYGIDEFSLEIPGGVMDPGEDPVTAGLRELREETGYTGAPAKLLGSVHPNPAMQSNRAHFVFVEGAVKSHELEWDADEELHSTLEPVESVLTKARNGGISHALVMNGLMLFEPIWWAMKKG
ncbi:MAG: NUDIX hydrolase [Verrucomicrobiota bacterium]